MRPCVAEHDYTPTCPDCKAAALAGGPVGIKRRDPYPMTSASPRPATKPCRGCKGEEEPAPMMQAQPPALQVSCKSTGIGDNLLALTTAAGLRDKYGLPVAFCCNPREAVWARLFWPWVVLAPLKVPTCADDEDQKKAFDAARTSRWRFWANKAGVSPILPEPLPLPDDAESWAIDHTHRVVLSPFSAWESRCWPLWHWLELEKLLYANGIATVILDAPKPGEEGRTGPFRGAKLIGEHPAKVAAVIKGALCVVGNDSGMIHVAGMMRTPGIGITHPVSDRGILDLYPTIKSVKSVGLTPGAVFDSVLASIRAGLEPGFPADAFAETVTDHDRWRIPAWLTIYSVLWRTVRELDQKSIIKNIVEIGVRAGQSAWTFLDALPGINVHGIDAEGADDALASSTGGFTGAGAHARKLLAGRDFFYQAADSRTLDLVPACDLCYVDGAHDFSSCLSDLRLAGRSEVKTVLTDDYANRAEVREACKVFMAEHPDRRGRFIASETGLYLIERAT